MAQATNEKARPGSKENPLPDEAAIRKLMAEHAAMQAKLHRIESGDEIGRLCGIGPAKGLMIFTPKHRAPINLTPEQWEYICSHSKEINEFVALHRGEFATPEERRARYVAKQNGNGK